MKCTYENYLGSYISIPLAEALTPSYTSDRGYSKAELACDSIGKLLALLVEKGVITLDEAISSTEIGYSVKFHKED